MIHQRRETGCKKMTGILCDYLDNRLDTATVQLLRRHTRNCAACRLVLDSARATIASYYSLMVPAPTAGASKAA